MLATTACLPSYLKSIEYLIGVSDYFQASCSRAATQILSGLTHQSKAPQRDPATMCASKANFMPLARCGANLCAELL